MTEIIQLKQSISKNRKNIFQLWLQKQSTLKIYSWIKIPIDWNIRISFNFGSRPH